MPLLKGEEKYGRIKELLFLMGLWFGKEKGKPEELENERPPTHPTFSTSIIRKGEQTGA